MIQNISTALTTTVKPEYNTMLANIDANFPAVVQNASNFYKGHSQFMNVTLDVTPLTPMRSMYQSLAEIEQTKAALQEAHINLKKKDIEVRRKESQLLTTEDSFDKELLEIEILELRSQAASSKNYVEGAIRKLNFFVNQHNSLLAKLGKESITEEDYEREEVKYHIMTCMKQALNAARSRGGVIDDKEEFAPAPKAVPATKAPVKAIPVVVEVTPVVEVEAEVEEPKVVLSKKTAPPSAPVEDLGSVVGDWDDA